MRRRNILAAALLIVCGVIYGFLALGLPERSLPNTPGPSFFPWVVTALLLSLSLALLFSSLVAARGEATDEEGPVGPDHRHLAVAGALAAFLVYVALLPVLGFNLATVPFFAVMMILFGERRPLLVGAASLAMTALLYILFRHGFGVFLPRGVLGIFA